MIYIFTVLIILGLIIFDHFYWKRRNLPPGPCPLPILGNTLSLALNPPGYQPLLEWKKKYGPVYTFWFGFQPTICITDIKIIKETIIDDSETFSGRVTLNDLIKIVRGGHFGVIETEGNLWLEQKRFILFTFRNFGMGKNLMQEKILDEVVFLIDTLKVAAASETVVGIQGEIDRAVGSIINSLLFGYRYEGEKIQEFTKLKSSLNKHMRFVMEPLTTMAMMRPLSIGKLPIFKPKLKRLISNMNELYDYFEIQINKHQQKLDSEVAEEASDESTDFCEAFLREMMKQQKSSDNQKNHSFSFQQLRNVCLDLWVAGLETTTNTISFAILYFIHYSEIRAKIYHELDTVVGNDRLITNNDKCNLSYLNAFISETQRIANLLPINFSRKTIKDTYINGFYVPKGSSVVPQISCILFDDTIFPDPFTFNPERFIDTETKKYKKIDEFIPFSVGKRQCMGEGLAKMELFLIISNLFNQFKIYPEDEKHLPSLEKRFGFALQPQPFKCKVESRF
uniref:Cytochrome P450 n=1 Tax=Panagrolaimus sp. ES5 TaxID=591445 RepID=A0AC34GQL3_9BILA